MFSSHVHLQLHVGAEKASAKVACGYRCNPEGGGGSFRLWADRRHSGCGGCNCGVSFDRPHGLRDSDHLQMLAVVFRGSLSRQLMNVLQVLGERIIVKNDILPANSTLVIHHLDDLSLWVSVELAILARTHLVELDEMLPEP